MFQRGQVLLDRWNAENVFGALHVSGQVDGFDAREIGQAAFLAPGRKPLCRVQVGAARIVAAQLGGASKPVSAVQPNPWQGRVSLAARRLLL
jgi:hypothetical protein